MTSIFSSKRGRMSPMFKSIAQVVRCPTCNRRLFDGFFVGIMEIICPRCHDPLTISCQAAPPVASYETGSNGNGVGHSENVPLLTVPQT